MADKYDYKMGNRELEGKGGVFRDTPEGKGKYVCLSPHALRRVAVMFEIGMAKHHNTDPLSFSRGFKFSSYLDSALRHLFQFEAGLDDEDHLAHAIANIAAMMHQQEIGLAEENDDLPLRQYIRTK
jgi:hypothetical protein